MRVVLANIDAAVCNVFVVPIEHRSRRVKKANSRTV